MSAMALQKPRKLIGHAKPRIAPPMPLHHDIAGYRRECAALGIDPMPWQEIAAKYATAHDAKNDWLYREFGALVARQQGKTTFAKPIIVGRLKAGRHIMHIAQVRELPRIMFEQIADALEETPELFPRRRGKIIWPRRGAGSESIVLTNGGSYRIAAAVTGSARGHSIDDLIIDELREMESFDVINSAKPAQRFSANPQTIYLTNEGTDKSVVLDSLFMRAKENDPALAFLQWSADPDYDAGDVRGWLQSNPAIGHYPQVLRDLEKDYLSAKLSGNLAGFETEGLCRRVATMRERLVDAEAWQACHGTLSTPTRPVMGVSMDPERQRGTAVMAWQDTAGKTFVTVLREATGAPIDTDLFGQDLRQLCAQHGIRRVAHDPLTDADLAKYFRKPEAMSGRLFANASSTFVEQVASKRLVWDEADDVTADLMWTARKDHDETGSFQAVRAKDDRPITASLATIRAVGLVFGPRPAPARIY